MTKCGKSSSEGILEDLPSALLCYAVHFEHFANEEPLYIALFQRCSEKLRSCDGQSRIYRERARPEETYFSDNADDWRLSYFDAPTLHFPTSKVLPVCYLDYIGEHWQKLCC